MELEGGPVLSFLRMLKGLLTHTQNGFINLSICLHLTHFSHVTGIGYVKVRAELIKECTLKQVRV